MDIGDSKPFAFPTVVKSQGLASASYSVSISVSDKAKEFYNETVNAALVSFCGQHCRMELFEKNTCIVLSSVLICL